MVERLMIAVSAGVRDAVNSGDSVVYTLFYSLISYHFFNTCSAGLFCSVNPRPTFPGVVFTRGNHFQK